jgi:hypothetical protein
MLKQHKPWFDEIVLKIIGLKEASETALFAELK